MGLFLFIIILACVWHKAAKVRRGGFHGHKSAAAVLDERFIRGEIEAAEYRRMKNVIQEVK